MNGSSGAPSETSSHDSTMDDNESITSSHFDDWFTERHGRAFHSSEAPYFLPADPVEMERLNIQHQKFKTLLGSNTFGPLAAHLVEEPGRRFRKRVVDLGSGSGSWVEEMAREFPHVKFIGIDLVPTGTRYPSDNVQFECYNFLAQPGIQMREGAVDAVHARSVSFGIHDYRRLLEESYRILKPNGLFLSAELDLDFQYHPREGQPTVDVMQATREVLRRIRSFAETRLGGWFNPATIPSLMRACGFVNITSREVEAPIGDWMPDTRMREVGRLARDVALRLGGSLRPALLEHGGSEGEIDALLAASSQEIQTCEGVIVTYRLVHGRRPDH